MKTRSLVVAVDEIELTTTSDGFELRFTEYGDGQKKRRATLKFKGGWWVQYIAGKLWAYVNTRQKEIDQSKSALKGES